MCLGKGDSICAFLLGRCFLRFRLGCPPSQDASHHQDYEPFLVGDPSKPSFATVTGRGDNPRFRHVLFTLFPTILEVENGTFGD